MVRTPAICLLAAVLSSTISAFAQQVDPKVFYEQNYAVAPNYRPGEPQQNLPSTSQPQPVTNKSQAISVSPQNKPTALPDQPTKRRDTRISVVINALNKQHFESVLQNIRYIAARNLADITHVYCLGATSETIPPDIERDFTAAGISISPYGAVPLDVPVTMSPVWIFSTLQGKRVLEGTMSIERFLSPEGDYQPSVAVKVTATPGAQLKNF